MPIRRALAVPLLLAACRPPPASPSPAPADVVVAEASPARSSAALTTLLVDLSELPDSSEETLRALVGGELDRDNGTIELEERRLHALAKSFVADSILNHGLEAFDFYDVNSYPRLAWWENVVVQLPEFVSYVPAERYSGYSDARSTEARLLAYLAYRIDRSPEHLQGLFERLSPVLFGLIDAQRYESAGFGRFTRGLLISHARIVGHPKYPRVMDELGARIDELDATEMFSGERTAASVAIYDALGLIDPKIDATFQRDDPGYSPGGEDTDVVWFSSFWLRRHREGNTDAVLGMLRTIDAHYSSDD